MTPTPETDAEADSPRNLDLDDLRAGSATQVVPAEFARRLERERDQFKRTTFEAQNMAKEILGKLQDAEKERDDLRAELKRRECWAKTWKGMAKMNYDLYASMIREVHDLRAENQRLAKVLSDLQAIRDLDC